MAGILQVLSTNIVPSYTPPEFVSSGLVAYYDPSNSLSYSGTGSTFNDLSGNSNNGTIVGPTYTAQQTGASYFSLDGTNDYIVTPNLVSAITGSEDHTVEMWVYANNAHDCLWSDLGSTNNPATSGYHFAGGQIITDGVSQQIITALWNGTETSRSIAGSGTLTGAWKHVVRTYSGTTLSSYLNAATAGAATMTWNSPPDDGLNFWYLAFGAEDITAFSGTTAGWLNGRIGILRVYNRALSSVEVTSNYNDARSIYGL